MDALPKKNPLVSDKNVKKRLLFAKEHIHKGLNFWNMIVWSDENNICTTFFSVYFGFNCLSSQQTIESKIHRKDR